MDRARWCRRTWLPTIAINRGLETCALSGAWGAFGLARLARNAARAELPGRGRQARRSASACPSLHSVNAIGLRAKCPARPRTASGNAVSPSPRPARSPLRPAARITWPASMHREWEQARRDVPNTNRQGPLRRVREVSCNTIHGPLTSPAVAGNPGNPPAAAGPDSLLGDTSEVKEGGQGTLPHYLCDETTCGCVMPVQSCGAARVGKHTVGSTNRRSAVNVDRLAAAPGNHCLGDRYA